MQKSVNEKIQPIRNTAPPETSKVDGYKPLSQELILDFCAKKLRSGMDFEQLAFPAIGEEFGVTGRNIRKYFPTKAILFKALVGYYQENKLKAPILWEVNLTYDRTLFNNYLRMFKEKYDEIIAALRAPLMRMNITIARRGEIALLISDLTLLKQGWLKPDSGFVRRIGATLLALSPETCKLMDEIIAAAEDPLF
ncbi:MAG: hypothetical protein LBL50_05355 [Candidatus Margulisbacteria bacterium]|jgi:AcrR family transcriptional regulator|nr:hypothetical protein [Candidatus Margulisiibacteriota bacterium]